ncbi:lipid II:glycine glycyltransferase FemX [Ornithinimicrobium sufpigmenti]|uniref:lipid II:glycine glycyltransferase FemX n=1 Tax=Ornithinimicrobium sufpigmenti TaxID=2508882 RepID=UPI0015E1A20A|nr:MULTISPECIES: peptidoglycan bridge formation glycyltransferase FemA/FemB family protein [unclassified Ornithinimicrobium]
MTVNMHVHHIGPDDRGRYEDVLDSLGPCEQLTFYHSWEWGEVIAERTGRLERVALEQDGELVGVAQVGLHEDHKVVFWYAPRGLAMDHSDPERVTAAYGALRDHFRGREGAAFLRVDPTVLQGTPAEAALDAAGGKRAAIFTQVERCWVAEVQPTPEAQLEWLKAHGLKSNTRRLFNKSRKAGVTVRASDDPQDLETLITMLRELDARKGGIGKHDDEHYRTQFAHMAPAGYQKVFLAEKDGRVGAASLMAIYGGEASFLHGASSADEDFRRLSPSYLLHQETMAWLAAHRPEVTRYNFWGIVSDENRRPEHPRHGYSEFKRSFGGYKVEYVRAREFVYHPLRRSALYLLETYRTRRYQND